jgi:signal transduction histidine kinase
MIRDMLDANRIEAGEPVPVRFEDCHLDVLTKDLIDNLSTIHGDRFSLKMNGDLMGFWSCDELQRVIENLVGNGIKYGSPTEKIEIFLTGLPNTVTISVRNQGKPIPETQQAMLFQPYKRLVSAQMGGHAGWGLGLILCKGIVEAHAGKIEVASNAESGTVFTVTLPRDSR